MRMRFAAPFILLCFILSACQNYQPDTTPDTGSPGPTVSDTSSNGISGEPTQADFGDKYDFMDFVFMSYTGANSYYTACKSAIKGGALLYDCYKFFYSDTSVFINADTNEEPEEWIGLYDEESNSLIPLCFASACTHDAARKDDKCFAQRFYGADSVYWFGVSDGSVFIINSSLVASYYSLEGALLSSVKYSSNDKYRCGILDFVFCEGNNIYFFTRPVGEKVAESLAGRIVGYSVSERQFFTVCDISFDVPQVNITIRKVNGIYYCISSNSVYTLDLVTGEYALLRDWTEAYRAVALFSGKMSFDQVIYDREFSKVSMRWMSEDFKEKNYYTYDFISKTVHEGAYDFNYAHSIGKVYFSYLGHTVVEAPSRSENGVFVFSLMDIDTGEIFDIPISPGDRERRIYSHNIKALTENGFIFNAYLRENERADLGRLVWISKEDYFSGNWGNYKEINMIY